MTCTLPRGPRCSLGCSSPGARTIPSPGQLAALPAANSTRHPTPPAPRTSAVRAGRVCVRLTSVCPGPGTEPEKEDLVTEGLLSEAPFAPAPYQGEGDLVPV